LRVTRDNINLAYSNANRDHAFEYIQPQAAAAFALLPMFTPFIPVTPFLDLLAGFESDLAFFQSTSDPASLLIQTEADLITYCERVASTVALMFVYITWHCEPSATRVESGQERTMILNHATQMGVALQLVNIARDIVEDAQKGRTYIPVAWFEHAGELDCLEVLLRDPRDRKLDDMLSRYALRLVRMAKSYYTKARPALEHLPRECRKGARLAIEIYMDIGREIDRRQGNVRIRVVVGRWQKLRTVVKVLYG
jgi:15-cis-phytoene synthase / lycopene beta-cyclase